MELRHSSSIISRKIALIGDGLCGKTSLLLAYLSEDKKFYSRPEPTVLDTCLIKVDLQQNDVKVTRLFTILNEKAILFNYTKILLEKRLSISLLGTRPVKTIHTKN